MSLNIHTFFNFEPIFRLFAQTTVVVLNHTSNQIVEFPVGLTFTNHKDLDEYETPLSNLPVRRTFSEDKGQWASMGPGESDGNDSS